MSVVPDVGDQGTARVRSPLQHASGPLPPRSRPDPGPPSSDCPHCGAAGSVIDGFCEVCTTELGDGVRRLPGASEPGVYRMADVVAEIRAIGRLAAGSPSEADLTEACTRAERLLQALRRQFVADVVVGHPAGRHRARADQA